MPITKIIGARADVGFDAAYSVLQTNEAEYTLLGRVVTYDAYFEYGASVWLIKADAELGLVWTDSTNNAITLYRGTTDPYWNYVRVRIWEIIENP